MTAKVTTDLESHAVTAIFAGYAVAPTLRIDVANTVIHGQHMLIWIYFFCSYVMMMLS